MHSCDEEPLTSFQHCGPNAQSNTAPDSIIQIHNNQGKRTNENEEFTAPGSQLYQNKTNPHAMHKNEQTVKQEGQSELAEAASKQLGINSNLALKWTTWISTN